MKRHDICAQVEQWLEELNKHQHIERGGNRNIQMNYQDLRNHYKQLREELAKLKPPAGLEDLDRPFSAVVVTNPPGGSSSSSTIGPTAASSLPRSTSSSTNEVTPMQSTSPKNHSSSDATEGATSADVPMPPPPPPPAQPTPNNNTTPIVEADAPSDASSTIENMLTDETTHYNEWWSGV